MNLDPDPIATMRAALLATAFLFAAQAGVMAGDRAENWKGVKVLPKLGAEVTMNNETVDVSKIALPWIVQDTDGDLLLIGNQHKGWVDQNDVVTLEEAPDYYTEFTTLYEYEAWGYEMRAFVLREKGELLSAIADYGTALRLSPTAQTYIGRGLAWDSKKDYRKALADFNLARRLEPTFALAYNNAAWLRATCPQEPFRNGSEAVELATRACELTDWNDANYLDTLAAAYAEAGDYDSAIKYQTKAAELSPDDADLMQHLALYKDHKPYREK